MRSQHGQYTVLTLVPKRTRAEVLNVHNDILVAAEQPDELRAHLAAPGIRVVTLTVTENGYGYSQSRGGLDVDDPAVQVDLGGGVPRTVVGQLVDGLRARAAAGAGPCAMVSCDNLNYNGDLLRGVVREFAASMTEQNDDLIGYIDGALEFPNTMVDRIVPSTEPQHLEEARRLIGASDQVPVPAEPFTMWVLQDRFPDGRPRWEAGGATFTDDVRGYELLKLRILNSSNSLLSYLGLLYGERLIADSLRRPGVRGAVVRMMRTEMRPTLEVPEAIDFDAYATQLLERFGNRAVGHRCSQVASDGSTKLPVRITDPVLHHHELGEVPQVIALLAAAYLRTSCDVEPFQVDVTGAPSDPRVDRLRGLGKQHNSASDLVQAVFTDSGIFPGRLAEASPWLDRVAELLVVLRSYGTEAAITEALG